MKKYFFLFIGLSLILSSCGTDAAEKVADEFHERFDKGEIDYICNNLLDTESTEEEIANFNDYLQGLHSKGKFTNREKEMGFSKKINNGISTVKFEYTSKLDGETIYEGIVLIDRGDGAGYKIHVLSMHPEKSVVDQYVDGF